MALTDNLISYWKLDESSGNAADSKGSNTLTNNNTVPFVAAKLNNGADFESTSSHYFDIADGSQSGLDISGDISVAFWIKSETNDGVSMLSKYSSGATNQRAYNYDLVSGTIRAIFSDDGTAGAGHIVGYATNASQITNGAMTYVVITFNIGTETCIFYVNGSSVASSQTVGTTLGATLHNSTQPFRLGSSGDAGSPTGFFDGVLDEVAIWSRVVSSTEVSQLYNSGNGLAYPFGEGGSQTVAVNNFLLMGV